MGALKIEHNEISIQAASSYKSRRSVVGDLWNTYSEWASNTWRKARFGRVGINL